VGRLQDLLLRHELHPRVVHRLPGRLRLHLPALKRLAPLQGDATPWIEDCLALPAGVETVSVNTRTGSILIGYAPETLSESDVLAQVQTLSARVRQNWSRLKHLDPQQDTAQILDCLQGPDTQE
jgi:hypothetical protein